MSFKVATGLLSTVTLNDGVVMPLFGLGTYKMTGQGSDGVISFALKNGYRMLDTATFYENETLVGQELKSSGVPRNEVFIVTKLWMDSHGRDRCQRAFKESLKKLDCEYIDLYLIHSPNGGHLLETYDALLEMKQQGLVRSIGVSNFGVQHLEGLRQSGRPAPSVNQIELHLLMKHQSIVDYCFKHNIAVMGYSPLAKAQKMEDKQLNDIAKKYGKTLGQLMIRWSVQHGYITIPKTSKKERVLENADVFDWSISEDDMKLIESMPEYGCTWDPTTSDWEKQK